MSLQRKDSDISAPQAFLFGWVVAFGVAGVINTLPFMDAAIYKAAKIECEKSLPRDQRCVINMVPEKK
jgi:hypothetical protein